VFAELAKASDIPVGALKRVKSGEKEIVLCNCAGRFYAVERRCGHMNSPLELGALDGTILTCPMHHVQFDVATGEALNVPIPAYFDEALPPKWSHYIAYKDALEYRIRICNLRVYPTKIEGDSIMVDLGEPSSVSCF